MKKQTELSGLILRAAEYVGSALCNHGCIVHRYDAISTSSVYLKVDAGVACSIRLSDHEGHHNLNYRFNYLAQVPGFNVDLVRDEVDRYYYQAGAVDRMISDILELREKRFFTYRDYEETVQLRLAEGAHARGFWKNAYLLGGEQSRAA